MKNENNEFTVFHYDSYEHLRDQDGVLYQKFNKPGIIFLSH